VTLHRDGEVLTLSIAHSRMVADEYRPAAGQKPKVKPGETVDAGAVLAEGPDGALTAEHGGVVDKEGDLILVRRELRNEAQYVVPAGARLRVRDGDTVDAGYQLTEGAQNPHRILGILGVEATQGYLLDEIQKVYRSQGVTINDKHVEIIVRQMLGKVRILRPGDSKLLPGDLVDLTAIEDINTRLTEQGGRTGTFQPVLLGITKASLETESLLSAASFQHTITVLAKAAIEGKTDKLVGLKENVIIGKLIPAGTGFLPRDGTETGQELESAGGVDLELSEEALAELLEDDLDIDKLAFADEDDDVIRAAGGATVESEEDEGEIDVERGGDDDEREEEAGTAPGFDIIADAEEFTTFDDNEFDED
jgi:DNA-directed RNA polymerase subunit beta'